MADFLLEIGMDEIPARMIAAAEQDLSDSVYRLLTTERLLRVNGSVIWENGKRFENGIPVPAGLTVNGEYVINSYSTPRRLAVYVRNVKLKQDDANERLTGPSWNVAFKDGAPTKAAEAFAKKAGVEVAALEKVTNAKGEYVGATVKRLGRAASELLATELPKEVLGLYWAKNMYWRAGKPERFVRPIRWIVALLDSAVVPLEIAGIKAGNSSRGHRILHGEAPVVIDQPKSYAEALRKAFAVVNVAERRETIRKALDAATRTVPGARWREDLELIETVVHLTEWPTVILGNFETEYLDLPEEVLVTVMRDHQKYFAVEGPDGKLLPHFLTVLNIQVDEEGYATIRHGNQKVLRARFKDARFFWEFDQKISLADRVESLKNVTFQKELGSYFWKTEQNLAAARNLSRKARSGGAVFEEGALLKAVELAKTDLTTELVKEFTELQGIIGGLYVRAQWKSGEVIAASVYSQYMPASIEDAIPSTVEGQLLGLADRIQTIVAMFGINMAPTGSKDPFALRRAANAIIKILAESELPLTLRDILESYTAEVATYDVGNLNERVVTSGPNITKSVMKDIDSNKTLVSVAAFLRERLSFYLKDVRGFAYHIVNAVLAENADDVRDAIKRAEDVTSKLGSPECIAVSENFKRMKNILKQAKEKGYEIGPQDETKLAPEARQLADASALLAPEVAALRKLRFYGQALEAIATLRPVVDAFFDKVMVLDPDPAIRGAHLGLIQEVLSGFSGIADFSEIVTT